MPPSGARPVPSRTAEALALAAVELFPEIAVGPVAPTLRGGVEQQRGRVRQTDRDVGDVRERRDPVARQHGYRQDIDGGRVDRENDVPQQLTVWSARIAHVWYGPTAISATPLRGAVSSAFLTATGSMLHATHAARLRAGRRVHAESAVRVGTPTVDRSRDEKRAGVEAGRDLRDAGERRRPRTVENRRRSGSVDGGAVTELAGAVGAPTLRGGVGETACTTANRPRRPSWPPGRMRRQGPWAGPRARTGRRRERRRRHRTAARAANRAECVVLTGPRPTTTAQPHRVALYGNGPAPGFARGCEMRHSTRRTFGQ